MHRRPGAAAIACPALITSYWTQIQAADQIANGINLAARVCLGVTSPAAQPSLRVVDPRICRQQAVEFLAAHQKFLTDLDTTPVPPRYGADDQVFRTQIPKAIAAVKGMISACDSGQAERARCIECLRQRDDSDVTNALDEVDPTVVHT